jgi:hypothetical protein
MEYLTIGNTSQSLYPKYQTLIFGKLTTTFCLCSSVSLRPLITSDCRLIRQPYFLR